jgi:hypothetical protein
MRTDAPKYGLQFSLRTNVTMKFSAMQALIEKAVGYILEPGEWNHMSFQMAEILGMRILFGQTRGINGQATFELHGITEVPTHAIPGYDGPEIIGIDQVVIDLLERASAGIWHVPSVEEIQAEALEAQRLEEEYYPGLKEQRAQTRPLQVGDNVMIKPFNAMGVITALTTSDAEVQMGQMRVRAKLDDLVW